jgi:hypothetical protein
MMVQNASLQMTKIKYTFINSSKICTFLELPVLPVALFCYTRFAPKVSDSKHNGIQQKLTHAQQM